MCTYFPEHLFLIIFQYSNNYSLLCLNKSIKKIIKTFLKSKINKIQLWYKRKYAFLTYDSIFKKNINKSNLIRALVMRSKINNIKLQCFLILPEYLTKKYLLIELQCSLQKITPYLERKRNDVVFFLTFHTVITSSMIRNTIIQIEDSVY